MISFKAFADEFTKIAWEDTGDFLNKGPGNRKFNPGHKDTIPGGLADKKKPSDFDKKELKEGIKDEASEHSKGNKEVAREIAMDHLTKEPHYYSKMKKLEAKEKNAAARPIISHWEVTTDEDGKVGGLADVLDQLSGRKPELGYTQQTIRLPIDEALEKVANGDMIQYFQDHPEKLKARQERDARKKKKYISDPNKKDTKTPTEKIKKASKPGFLDTLTGLPRVVMLNPSQDEVAAMAAHASKQPDKDLSFKDQIEFFKKMRASKEKISAPDPLRFKTPKEFVDSVRALHKENGWHFGLLDKAEARMDWEKAHGKVDEKGYLKKSSSAVKAGLRKVSKIKYTMPGDNKAPSQPYQGQVGLGETNA